QIGKLQLHDLERIQARAAGAAAFEFRRYQLLAELATRGEVDPAVEAAILGASEPLDLEDVRAVGKRRKKGAAAQARREGLSGLASLLWTIGSTRTVASADASSGERGRKRKAPTQGEAADPGPEAEVETAEAETAEAETAAVETAAVETAAVETAEASGSPDAVSESAPKGSSVDGEISQTTAAASAVAVPPATETTETLPDASSIEFDPNAEPAALALSFAASGANATGPQALAGARAICMDDLSSDPEVRRRLRELLLTEGVLVASEGPGKRSPKKRGDRRDTRNSQARPEKPAAQGVADTPAVERRVRRRRRNTGDADKAQTATKDTETDSVLAVSAAPPSDAGEATSTGEAEATATDTPADHDAPSAGGPPPDLDAQKPADGDADGNSPTTPPPPSETTGDAAPETTSDAAPETTSDAAPETASDAAPETPAGDRPKRSRGKGEAKKTAKKEKPSRYLKLVGRRDPCAKVGVGNLLSLHRGEREGTLSLDIEVDDTRVAAVMGEALALREDNPTASLLRSVCLEAWHGTLGKTIKNAARKMLKQKIDRIAIGDYCEALRPLLLAPAFGRKPVMGIDPGFETGCRIAVVGEDGRLIASDHVYPLQPKIQAPQAKARIAEMCVQHKVAAIVVTTAGGGRDVERLCREVKRDVETLAEVAITSVDGDATAVYAGSRVAKEELPGTDTAVRRATSAARRVQEPLAELIKIDPRKFSLGQYQHEVDQEELRAALEQVVTSCISEVSVDINAVTADRLARVVGFSHASAKAVVAHRDKAGPFRTRAQLLEVEGVAGNAFEQAAGFLRIEDGENPLDRTTIHPERYGQVTEMAADLGVTVGDLLGNAELIGKLDHSKYLGKAAMGGIPLGQPTLDALLQQLRVPGADPRPAFEAIDYEPGLASFADLEVGMELAGVVTHVAGFGAFIDVGLPQEALVHVSELSHGFVESPSQAVHIGQKVRGKVLDIDADRKRFGMSLRALMPRPERPEGQAPRRGRSSDKPGGKGGRRDDGGSDRDSGRGRGSDRGRGSGGGSGGGSGRGSGGGPGGGKGGARREPREERVLNFNMDLSALAERLKNS
ncbi:MAG: helix-hairpin-helix domain-containing protein, partial [Nannocystaceae bacterium]|nr:helix-hairpin-helix domain-containing protein [Nannocystaceae bacterium]